jgi:hypothetical protein
MSNVDLCELLEKLIELKLESPCSLFLFTVPRFLSLDKREPKISRKSMAYQVFAIFMEYIHTYIVHTYHCIDKNMDGNLYLASKIKMC